MDSTKKSGCNLWEYFFGDISILAVIAAMSGSGIGAVNFQYMYNTQNKE